MKILFKYLPLQIKFYKIKKTVLKINANKSMKYKDYTIQDYKLSKLLHLHNFLWNFILKP